MKPSSFLVLGVLLGVLQTTKAPASPGALDPGFNGTGIARHPLHPGEESGMAVAYQVDGKVVAAGYCQNGSYYEFFAIRYNTDGSLDESFGDGGRTLVNFGHQAICIAVRVQSDGKIVLAGSGNDSEGRTRFAVARLNADGTIDTTFGIDGKAMADFGSLEDRATGLIIQPDGMIVVAGYSSFTGNLDMSIARFTPTGALDTTFDGDGKATVSFGSTSDYAWAVHRQATDGKLVLTGSTQTASGRRVALARFNSNGSLDASFDGDGRLITSIAGFATSATLEPAVPGPRGEGQPEKIVVAGVLNSGYTVFAARLHLGGTLDTSFDGDGIATRTFSTLPGISNVFVTGGSTSRKITVCGWLQMSDSYLRMILGIRYTGSGALDTSFDGDGINLVTPGLGCSGLGGAAINLSHQVVQATTGYVSPSEWGLQVVRLAGNGQLDSSFDDDGIRFDHVGIHDAVPGTVAVLSDDRILAVGNSFNGGFIAARYRVDGALDPTFADGGAARISPGARSPNGCAMALQADGKIVMAGSTGSGSSSSLIVSRLLADGSRDSSFSGDGSVITGGGVGWNTVGGLVIQPDGKILLAGGAEACDIFCQSTYFTVLLVRLNPDGSMDDTFGTGGAVTVPLLPYAQGLGVALQPDGRIVVVGECYLSSQTRMMVVRYTSTGQLDTSFNGSGVAYAPSIDDASANAVRILPDGGILVAGTGRVSVDGDYILLKYTPTGALDSTFGSGGVASAAFDGADVDIAYGLAVHADGRIVATGSSRQNLKNVISVARFSPDGALDDGFGNGGRVLIDLGSPSDVGRSVAIDSFGRIVILGDSGGQFGVVRLQGDDVSAVESPADPATPSGLRALGPNPFRREVRVFYRVDRATAVDLRVYSVSGALVATLAAERAEPGEYERVWDGRGDDGRVVPSGVYFVRLEADGRGSTRSVIRLK